MKKGDELYLFLVNNQSGNGFKVWKKISKILLKKNIEYKAIIIKKDAKEMLKIKDELTTNIKALVIIGGDGTIQKAVSYIGDTEIPIGIIPAGSGNDFARALNIPKNIQKALKKILLMNTTTIDVMQVNNQLCLTVVGVGFDAKVTEITNQSKIKKWLNYFRIGKFAYIFSVLRAVLSYKPTDVEINIDGKTKSYRNVWLIAIANTPYYGGGLKICPDADESDNNINLCIAHSLSRIELLLFFPLVFIGKHTLHRSVSTLEGQSIQVTSKESILVQGDGEMLGTTPTSISIKRKNLKVII
ncbi:diacylglycerol/lipid kinase family protein [Anaerobacillus arseniciselenatis]|uniref:diacylglycerol/lipid kinase family protein n=1 Tax=Anaerobacillus arseniciselenatis TaxID=85682 RepID=UPI000A055F5D|nr:diacylglycerol kinase family protein [Anaerobacillus arseniciselenatis]